MIFNYKNILQKLNWSKQPKIDLFYQHPLPLYSPEHQLALFWSAKSGCTFAVKWFLFQIGELEQALQYDSWIHNYRENIFYNKPDYKKNFRHFSPKNTRIIKVVRNPFSRAVSSYLMAVRSGYENESMSLFLNRKVDEKNGFSFEEFIDYLFTIDLRQCNIHHRIQTHPSEENGFVIPNFVIKLENSLEELRTCESKLGLKKANLENFRSSGHNTYRKKWTEYWGAVKFYRHLGSKMLPDTKNFYNESTLQKVSYLYRVDFKNYPYNSNNLTEYNSKELDKISHVDLLQHISTQFPASGPISLLNRPLGYWNDSWCTNKVIIEFMAIEDIHQIEIMIRLPGNLVTYNEIMITSGENHHNFQVSNQQDHTLQLDVCLNQGSKHRLIIRSAFSKTVRMQE